MIPEVLTNALVDLTEAVREKKENPAPVSFFRGEKKEKGPSKLDLVVAWMKENPQQLEEKNQTTLDAYETATGQKTNLPYIREAKKKVSQNDQQAAE